MSIRATEPLVSIVLPTYNGERHLAESLESCIAQTYRNWELIVVDDASSDATPAIIAEHSTRDERIRSIRNAENLKLPRSLNRGFATARGELLTWTSDDNAYLPHALGALTSHLIARPDIDVVTSDFTLIREDGCQLPPWSPNGNLGTLEELPLRNTAGASFLYRRKVHDALNGYAEDLFLVEDYDFWLRASARFNMEFIRDNLYRYRVHGGSLTARRAREVDHAMEKCLARNLPVLSWMDSGTATKAYRSLIDRALSRADRAAAARYAALALIYGRLSPWALGISRVSQIVVPQGLQRWRLRRRLKRDAREVFRRVAPERRVVLIDDGLWGAEHFHDGERCATSLPGQSSLAADDVPPGTSPAARRVAQGRCELIQLHATEDLTVVVGSPAFWWMETDLALAQFLRHAGTLVLETERLKVFNLQSGRSAVTEPEFA